MKQSFGNRRLVFSFLKRRTDPYFHKKQLSNQPVSWSSLFCCALLLQCCFCHVLLSFSLPSKTVRWKRLFKPTTAWWIESTDAIIDKKDDAFWFSSFLSGCVCFLLYSCHWFCFCSLTSFLTISQRKVSGVIRGMITACGGVSASLISI